MTHAEKLREIWKNKPIPTPFLMRGLTPEEKKEMMESLTEIVFNKLLPLISKPKDGKTPTKEDILSMIEKIMPTNNDLLKLITPLIPKVKDGIDGKTPTAIELRNLILPLIPKVKDGENGKTPSKIELETIIRPLILSYMEGMSKEAPQLTYDQIKGVAEPIIRQMMTETRKGWFGGGGGGDNVRAGSGVTITTNAIGAKVISASGGGTVETPTGTVNGSNVTFTVTATPKWIVADGITYYDGAGYSISGTTITMVSPPVQYIRAIS